MKLDFFEIFIFKIFKNFDVKHFFNKIFFLWLDMAEQKIEKLSVYYLENQS